MLRGRPLRIRLTAAILLLVSGALAISGVVASHELSGYLMDRLDNQLEQAQAVLPHDACTAASSPSNGRHNNNSASNNDDSSSDDVQPDQFYIAWYDDNGVDLRCSQLAEDSTAVPNLPHLSEAWARDVDGDEFTAPSTQDATQWRVLVTHTSDGDFSIVATSTADVSSTMDRLLTLELIAGGSLVLVLGLMGYLLVRQSLRSLVAVEQTAVAIAGGDLSSRVGNRYPRTEVGKLTTVLNEMLDRVQSSFERQRELQAAAEAAEQEARASEDRMRRFVADASHELRTPLTSIRGFAELYRQGAVDGPEVARVMDRIESEAARMGLLVEDLLLLARLDQERPLVLSPVDLLLVAADVVHDARAGSPDHPTDLDVTGPPPIVLGDESRLRQVLHNLVSNAQRHTPPGTPIVVRVGVRDAVATVEVVDGGPGLPEYARHRIFERFYRTDTARGRDSGGAGLGLSIVAALVAAHSGAIDVVDTPGGGATFRVRLPLLAPVGEVPQPRSAGNRGVADDQSVMN
ncbi:MAG TPA: HAMP domain-containing sensor histidine kinase [Sporichthyaceae bacterium]|jgi:two-component system OmpR family sensor kinase|nr:HAMP domain-containing sensor histidine kinase [Sporichthyaceae bacterium]